MGEHKNCGVIWRIFAPPAFPAFIRPGAANRPEHVSPENPRSEVVKAKFRHLIVDTCLAIGLRAHPAKYLSEEEPFHQLGTIDAQRVLQTLIWSCAVSINRS